MVELFNLDVVGNKLKAGKYKSEEVMKHFRYFYSDKFTSHDLTKACSILKWTISRRSGKSDIITVIHDNL